MDAPGRGAGHKRASAAPELKSETRIRTAPVAPRPVVVGPEIVATQTSMKACRPEPTASELFKEAHGYAAEARCALNELTLTLDRLSRALG